MSSLGDLTHFVSGILDRRDAAISAFYEDSSDLRLILVSLYMPLYQFMFSLRAVASMHCGAISVTFSATSLAV